MKHVELKFEDYKFTVPSEKAITKKLEPLIEELKKCGSIKTALPIIKKWNKAMIDIYTNMSVIYVKYSCDTTNVAYQRAQDKSDEVSPIISKFNNDYMKIVTKALYRKDLEKLYGPYLLKMYDYQLKSFDEKIIPEKYYEQQKCYRLAASELFNVPAEKIKVCLFYLRYGKEIDITSF